MNRALDLGHRAIVAASLLALAASCGDDGADGSSGSGGASAGAGLPTSGPGQGPGSGSGGGGADDTSSSGGGPSGPGSTGSAGGPSTGSTGAGGFDPPPPPPEVCEPPVDLTPIDGAVVVGDGSAASCTEAALDAALARGGVIAFDCGGAASIPISSRKVVTSDLVIDGGGVVTLEGTGGDRLFEIDTGGNFEATTPVLTLQRIELRGGRASGTAIPLGTDVDGGGGAVYFRGGRVVAIEAVFVDNQAALEGPDVAGGAIYGVGVGGITVVGSVFTGNRAANGGAMGSLGGPITVVNSTFTENRATGRGANYIDENGQQQGRGGNGGVMSMDGQGQTLEICGSTFRSNAGGAFGGAVMRTSYESEPSTITLSTFDDNDVSIDPGGSNTGAGAIYLQGSAVTIQSSTISRNRARANAGVWILAHGPSAPATANLVNVTIADNLVFPQDPFTDTGLSGGLTVGDDTTGLVLNCTIAGNSAQFASGIARVSTLEIRNTIIANTALNLYTPLNCTGTSFDTPPASGSNNLQFAWVDGEAVPTGPQSDMDCTAGIQRADPLLGDLGDSGGASETRVPAAGSPAIGGGTDCPEVDQRGEPRDPSTCTIGAVEVAR